MLLTFSIIINNIVFIILLFEFFSLHGSELKLTLYIGVRKSWLKICFFSLILVEFVKRNDIDFMKILFSKNNYKRKITKSII